MSDGGGASSRYRPTRAQWSLAGTIIAFVVGVVLFRLIKGMGLGQTAAFYIGIPTILALILTLTAPSGRIMGMTLKAITILLLLAIPVAGETFVCVIIAAPLFYAVGIIVALIVGAVRKTGRPGTARIVVLPAVALVMSMEGVVPALTLPGDNTVTAGRVVTATPDQVAAALARPLRLSDVAPSGVLALGFPKPVMDHGSPLRVGERRTVMFEGGHHRPGFVAAQHWGETPSALEFEVAKRTGDSVRFRPTSDATPLATWLTWRSADVRWHAVDPGTHRDHLVAELHPAVGACLVFRADRSRRDAAGSGLSARRDRPEVTTGLDITALRSGAVLVPVLLVAALWLAAPGERVGAALAALWNAVWLMAVNAVAVAAGWWVFGTEGVMWAGVPVDVVLGWAVLWGAVPILLMEWVNPAVSVAVLVVGDALAMGGLTPLVQLRGDWYWGEALAVAWCLVPGVVLGWATARRRALWVRVSLQVALFGTILLFVVPAVAFASTAVSWSDVDIGGPVDSVLLQALALVMVIALRAVADFAHHGGTPFPWDPPRRLVTTGPYGFVANPMQLAAVLVLLLGAAVTGVSGLVLAAAVGAVFASGIAAWHERDQLSGRFGDQWSAYRQAVHDWVPRWRPYPDRQPARLYVAVSCDPCSEVAHWLQRRHPAALAIERAENHPDELRRVQYESDSVVLQGTRAVGAALEHVSLGWAVVGWVMRAPVLDRFVQLLADAVGAGPRAVSR